MTTPTAPSAREVAKHLDRRRMRRRLAFWIVLLALAIAFALYARCGNGFGLGGQGAGAGGGGSAGSATPKAVATVCSIRVSAAGISVDGAPKTVDEALAACKAREVTVLVTGDAKQGDWETLQRGFDAAHTSYKVDKPH
ncbi:MAG TPA: hypothetical protein VGM88_03275 [Kofleriaceae bacterium]